MKFSRKFPKKIGFNEILVVEVNQSLKMHLNTCKSEWSRNEGTAHTVGLWQVQDKLVKRRSSWRMLHLPLASSFYQLLAYSERKRDRLCSRSKGILQLSHVLQKSANHTRFRRVQTHPRSRWHWLQWYHSTSQGKRTKCSRKGSTFDFCFTVNLFLGDWQRKTSPRCVKMRRQGRHVFLSEMGGLGPVDTMFLRKKQPD